jgi:lipopolysaccharide transport system ATP-binding protein
MTHNLLVATEGLGKRYELGERAPYLTLRESLPRMLRLPGARSREAGTHGFIWALRDVTLTVNEGEALGLIGPNGAGKTTLLKLLTRITEPTEGTARLWGRVGSLLEVGTGLHGELTGRENIFLNGAILGMRRAEVQKRFDDIVAFGEIEQFLDTPVKHYSSGMYVRLAFAVAAHLEPEILLIDEVLAVGDIAFQRRCLEKMDEVARGGSTIILVSHNMGAVTQLCSRAVIIDEGRIISDGPPQTVIPEYLALTTSSAGERTWAAEGAPGGESVRLRAVRVRVGERVTDQVRMDQKVGIEVDFDLLKNGLPDLAIVIYLLDGIGTHVLTTANTRRVGPGPGDWYGRSHEAGSYRAICALPANLLNDTRYHASVDAMVPGRSLEARAQRAVSFTVVATGADRDELAYAEQSLGVVRPRLDWRTMELTNRT